MDSPYFPTEPPQPARTSRIGPRILTALIGIPIVLFVVWQGGWIFRLFCLLLAWGAMRELQNAVGKTDRLGGARIIGVVAYPAIFLAVWRGITPTFSFALLATLLTLSVLFYGRASRLNLPSIAMTLLATLYVGLFALLPTLREGGNGEMFYLMLFSVWASDTAAYYGGRAFGRSRLSLLSPGKTAEGLLFGVFAATLVACLIASQAGFSPILGAILGAIIAFSAPLGDLAESFLKRELGVKDLGAIFPGHGGILDRCDSVLFATLGLFLYITWLIP